MRALLTASSLAVLWLLVAASGLLEPLERLSAQARYLTRPAPGFHAPLTIVAIDERALKRYGRMPWNRDVFAHLLDQLKTAGAAVVGVDVAFNEPAGNPREDRELARALAGVPTVLPTFMAFADAGHRTLQPIDPLPAFARRATLGSVQLSSKPQAMVWEVEPYQDTAHRRVPAFPVAVVGLYRRAAWHAAPAGWLWRMAPNLIDYRGPAGSAPQVSVADVLAGQLSPRALAGHMALVGATASGLPDTNFAVPDGRGGPMSGIEISAHVIDNLLGGGFQRRTSSWALALLLATLALGPGRWLCRPAAGRIGRSPALALWLGAWTLLAVGLFRLGIWLDWVPVVGYAVACYLAGLFAERADLLASRTQLLARYAADLAGEAHRQRSRIEGELHDGIQQLLVVFDRELRQLRELDLGERASARLGFLDELRAHADDEVRRLRGDLLPPALRYGGLAEALPVLANEVGARTGLAVRVEFDDWEPLPDALESELYWLVKEALNNADKHAEAHEVVLRLARVGGEARLEVIDDGRGFEPPRLGIAPAGLDHSGLHRLWLRMQGNRGTLTIDSKPGHGTRVRFSLPPNAQRSSP